MTQKEHDALFHFGQGRSLTPNTFAQEYFNTPEHEYLLTSESKTGGGYDVVIGKKGWRIAGGILAKLANKGWLQRTVNQYVGPRGGVYEKILYSLTTKGHWEAALWEAEQKKKGHVVRHIDNVISELKYENHTKSECVLDMKLTLIEEERPFLVAGYSILAKGYVFGFPYYYKTKSKGGISSACPCILLPVADDGVTLPNEEEYDFAAKRGEFHPILGKYFRFVRESNNIYYFEDGVSFKVSPDNIVKTEEQ